MLIRCWILFGYTFIFEQTNTDTDLLWATITCSVSFVFPPTILTHTSQKHNISLWKRRRSFCLHMVGKSVLLHRIKRVTRNFHLCSGCKHQKNSVHFKMYLFTCTLKPPHTWLVFCLWSATCGDPGSVTSPSGSGRLSWSACPGSDSLIGYPTVPEMRNVSGNACWLKKHMIWEISSWLTCINTSTLLASMLTLI